SKRDWSSDVCSDDLSNGVKAAATTGSPAIKEMSFLDRWLAVWILLAMGIGLALGRFVPGLNTALDAMSIGGISLPIAIGLLVMRSEERRVGRECVSR